jgi:plasmid maintenance system antidote protein VapI
MLQVNYYCLTFAAMNKPHTSRFRKVLKRELRARHMSINALATATGMEQSTLNCFAIKPGRGITYETAKRIEAWFAANPVKRTNDTDAA